MAEAFCRWFNSKVEFFELKSHYFFFNGALAGIIPFLPVYAKQLGISAVVVGFIYTLLPFLAMIAKPFFGIIADRTQKLKQLLVVFLCCIMVSSTVIMFIPPKDHSVQSEIACTAYGTTFSTKTSPDLDCLNKVPRDEDFLCYLMCYECSSNDNANLTAFGNTSRDLDCKKNEINTESNMFYTSGNDSKLGVFEVSKLLLDQRNMNVVCVRNLFFLCNGTCTPKVHECFVPKDQSEYSSLQFWLFFCFVILVWVSTGIAVSLADAACFNTLGERSYLYGRQRLWGTVGWGLFATIVGILNHLSTGSSFVISYHAGFSLVSVLILTDLLVIKKIKMENLTLSKSILKDVGKLLSRPNVLAFICSVFVVGALTGLFWSYLFWHLMNLNASQLLLGIVSLVQCFVGELPFFYFSGKIIAKIGHFNTLTISFMAFGVRFILYSCIRNPWWVLPVEILQGPTFGLFYSAMASYASVAALPGTEATMQGLIGGTFEGLGVAAGSLLGGFGMEHYKGSTTFFWAGIISFVYCIIHIVFGVCITYHSKIDKMKQEPGGIIESPEEAASFI